MIKKHFVYIILLRSFQVSLTSVLVLSLNWKMNLPRILPSAFGPFIGHHQGLFASGKVFFLCVCFVFF